MCRVVGGQVGEPCEQGDVLVDAAAAVPCCDAERGQDDRIGLVRLGGQQLVVGRATRLSGSPGSVNSTWAPNCAAACGSRRVSKRHHSAGVPAVPRPSVRSATR